MGAQPCWFRVDLGVITMKGCSRSWELEPHHQDTYFSRSYPFVEDTVSIFFLFYSWPNQYTSQFRQVVEKASWLCVSINSCFPLVCSAVLSRAKHRVNDCKCPLAGGLWFQWIQWDKQKIGHITRNKTILFPLSSLLYVSSEIELEVRMILATQQVLSVETDKMCTLGGFVLWHINPCGLFNVKSGSYIYNLWVNILLVRLFLNELELICLFAVKWFQEFLSNTHNSIWY